MHIHEFFDAQNKGLAEGSYCDYICERYFGVDLREDGGDYDAPSAYYAQGGGQQDINNTSGDARNNRNGRTPIPAPDPLKTAAYKAAQNQRLADSEALKARVAQIDSVNRAKHPIKTAIGDAWDKIKDIKIDRAGEVIQAE
jgi:hypothetical protein